MLSQHEINEYCKVECKCLAQLVRALIDAHRDADLELKHYYGAGSTASALLDKFGIREKRGEHPKEMEHALACAFFGGRFENSVIGAISGPVYNYDINSAYPYHISRLPCLEHGTWKHVDGDRNGQVLPTRIRQATLALVRWELKAGMGITSWGPLPMRATDGTIAFPLEGRGWCWKDEYLIAEQGWNVRATEAWFYHTDCDCKPFADIPRMYLERIKLGKDSGKGQPFKLGPNAVYGKLAQSQGLNPPFQSWIWAGNITSSTRAQLLRAILSANVPWNILALATDGIFSRERLNLPRPFDTGTFNVSKPLGDWDEKVFPTGVFLVRPGIYFPQNPTEEQLKEVRARGLGKRVLYEQWRKIVEAFNAGKEDVQVTQLQRFIGVKSALSYGEKSGVKRSPDYGEWVEHPIVVSFDARPKRQPFGVGAKRGMLSESIHLKPWPKFDWDSEPYKKAVQSPEAILLQLMEQICEEQPDSDFSEVDTGETQT